MSDMILEKNAVFSRGKRSRHVDVMSFFIKDRVDKWGWISVSVGLTT